MPSTFTDSSLPTSESLRETINSESSVPPTDKLIKSNRLDEPVLTLFHRATRCFLHSRFFSYCEYPLLAMMLFPASPGSADTPLGVARPRRTSMSHMVPVALLVVAVGAEVGRAVSRCLLSQQLGRCGFTSLSRLSKEERKSD